MERLGLQLTTFNIQDFTDRQSVIANMGAEMAAEISRNAKLASINAEQDVAVRQNQLDLKRAELQSTPTRLGRSRRGEGHHQRRTVQDPQGQGAGG